MAASGAPHGSILITGVAGSGSWCHGYGGWRVCVGSVSVRSLIPKMRTSSGDDGGITRYVGELRDIVTGKVVVDPDCPF